LGEKQLKTAVSLFAGVGGFDLALERQGVKVVASVEIDKKAQDVLRRHFPDSTIFGDITGVTGEQLRAAGFEPSNGIITGGFPCQDLSVAGKRAGLGGARSGLFWEICRLLDETRAQNFILENVPGLLSSNGGKDMAVVVEALVKRGYRIAWRVLDAQHFGVPQRRRRVFIVGCLGNSGRSPEEILAIGQSRARYLEASNKKRKDTAGAVADGVGTGSRAGNFELYDFPDREVAPTLNALRARDTMTYSNNTTLASGKDIANCIPAELYHHGSVVNQDANNGHLVIHES
jgi:DNA (cytosine-5)-methyltransferase 1